MRKFRIFLHMSIQFGHRRRENVVSNSQWKFPKSQMSHRSVLFRIILYRLSLTQRQILNRSFESSFLIIRITRISIGFWTNLKIIKLFLYENGKSFISRTDVAKSQILAPFLSESSLGSKIAEQNTKFTINSESLFSDSRIVRDHLGHTNLRFKSNYDELGLFCNSGNRKSYKIRHSFRNAAHRLVIF